MSSRCRRLEKRIATLKLKKKGKYYVFDGTLNTSLPYYIVINLMYASSREIKGWTWVPKEDSAFLKLWKKEDKNYEARIVYRMVGLEDL